jgi:hypothetical protein
VACRVEWPSAMGCSGTVWAQIGRILLPTPPPQTKRGGGGAKARYRARSGEQGPHLSLGLGLLHKKNTEYFCGPETGPPPAALGRSPVPRFVAHERRSEQSTWRPLLRSCARVGHPRCGLWLAGSTGEVFQRRAAGRGRRLRSDACSFILAANGITAHRALIIYRRS